MDKSKLTNLLVALFALISAACADTTLPEPQEWGIEAGVLGPNSNDLPLPPVKVVAPGCDPYTDLNWCRDSGDCMMGSVSDDEQRLSGCLDDPPGGGGTPTCPYWDPSCPRYGGGGTPYEPPPPLPDTCRTGDAVVDDLDVHGLFNPLWQKSLQQGVELGGWIVMEGPNNYKLVPFQQAVHTPCGIDILEKPPANLVSMFHTHPWQLGQARMCDGSNTVYFGTPSQADRQTLQQLGLAAGYFIDYLGVGKYTATGGEAATRLGRCGY